MGGGGDEWISAGGGDDGIWRGGAMLSGSCPSWAAGSELRMVPSEDGHSGSSGNLLESKPLVELSGGKLTDADVVGRVKSPGYPAMKPSGWASRRVGLTLWYCFSNPALMTQ
jgi:hypothetical protein